MNFLLYQSNNGQLKSCLWSTCKQNVVTTLMRRQEVIPSRLALCAEEKSHIREVLRLNGYKDSFIDRVFETRGTPPDPKTRVYREKRNRGFSVHTRCFRENKRSPSTHNIQTAFKPHQTLASVFRKPKDRLAQRKNTRNNLQSKMQGLHFHVRWVKQTELVLTFHRAQPSRAGQQGIGNTTL